MKAHNVQVKVNHYTELHVCAAVEHDICVQLYCGLIF